MLATNTHYREHISTAKDPTAPPHTVYMYIEILVGNYFARKLVLQNICSFNFREYTACVILRPVAENILRFYFHDCRLT